MGLCGAVLGAAEPEAAGWTGVSAHPGFGQAGAEWSLCWGHICRRGCRVSGERRAEAEELLAGHPALPAGHCRSLREQCCYQRLLPWV